jgi:UDP-N-acetyl-D-mannosaminuronate dehydrogenase
MIQKELPLQGSCEELFLKRAIFSTKQNTLDALRTERNTIVDNSNLANHVAVIDTNEIQALNDVTNFHFLLRYLTVDEAIIHQILWFFLVHRKDVHDTRESATFHTFYTVRDWQLQVYRSMPPYPRFQVLVRKDAIV